MQNRCFWSQNTFWSPFCRTKLSDLFTVRAEGAESPRPPLQAVDRKISLLLPLQILGSLSQWTFPEELFVNSEPDHCDIGPRLRDWRFCEIWSSGDLSSQWILNSTIYPLSLQMPFVKSWRSLFPLIVLFPLVSPQVLEIKTKKFKALGVMDL